jgi:hypothetical protein
MISLNEKYNIPFLSSWVGSNGDEYLALKIEHAFKKDKVPIIAYAKVLNDENREYFIKNNIKNFFVCTVEHFRINFTVSK